MGLNHKWTRIEDDYMPSVGKIKKWKCNVCSCIKSVGCYKYATPDFERNGQLYTDYIECIDYAAEDLKTID